jgi:hypothetical protein
MSTVKDTGGLIDDIKLVDREVYTKETKCPLLSRHQKEGN